MKSKCSICGNANVVGSVKVKKHKYFDLNKKAIKVILCKSCAHVIRVAIENLHEENK